MTKQQPNPEEMNFWSRGRWEQKRFYDIRMNRSTNIMSFVFGLLLGTIIIAPFGLMIFEYIMIYGYDYHVFTFYLLLVWIALMLFNGLSNYFTVKLAQAKDKDIRNLQEIQPRYIFFYQCLNIGFGLFTLVLIVIFGMKMLGTML